MKRTLSIFCLMIVVASLTTAAAPTPDVTFTLVQGLPATMNVGDTYTVIVQVESDQEFLYAQALPSFYMPGRGVVALGKQLDRSRNGTIATLALTYIAKGSTAEFPDGVAPVHFVVGVRYQGGYVVAQDYLFNVAVP